MSQSAHNLMFWHMRPVFRLGRQTDKLVFNVDSVTYDHADLGRSSKVYTKTRQDKTNQL
jgi:hypothetical protein